MYQERNIKRTIGIVTSLFVFFVAGRLYAAGQQCSKQTSNKCKMQNQQQMSQITEHQSPLCSAKYLVGSDVRSFALTPMRNEHKMGTMGKMNKSTARKSKMERKTEKIGTVRELIFDDNHNKVDCVIVASQGKYYPVPWWAFDVHERSIQPVLNKNYVENPAFYYRYDTGRPLSEIRPVGAAGMIKRPALCLNITKEQLTQAPAIKSISLERISNPGLRQEVNSFYSQRVGMKRGRWEMGYTHTKMSSAKNSSEKEGTTSSSIHVTAADLSRASKVIGLKVQDILYNDVHKIQNVLIDVRRGRLTFGLVSFGGFLGLGNKTAAVPWQALTVRVPEGYAKLDVSRMTLEAAAVKNNDVQKLSQHQYARHIYSDFGVEPYWQVYGFVPGEEMIKSANPWLPDSTYNKNFDSSKLTTVEGTIESVGSFYPVSESAPGTCLNLKTKDDTLVTVYAGPKHFTMQQNLDLKSGNKISVTGSRTMVNGKSVIIASELQVEGKTLRLRDQNGKPEWKTGWSRQEK
jgi:sporulation protein YlmC with PRC-barrel domain